jgi:hypothetical protein
VVSLLLREAGAEADSEAAEAANWAAVGTTAAAAVAVVAATDEAATDAAEVKPI